MDLFSLSDVPIPIAILKDGEVESANEAFTTLHCESDLPLLRKWITAYITKDDEGSMAIHGKDAIRTYRLAHSKQASDRYLLAMSESKPYITGDPHKKKALCLAKARNCGQEYYDHADWVFRHAIEDDRFGPIEGWPDALWRSLYFIFDRRTACAIHWGPEFRLIYNLSYVSIAEHRHPKALGLPTSHPESWGPQWHQVRSSFETALNGTAFISGPTHFPLWDEHRLVLYERFFDYTLAPIDDEDGRVLGVLNTILECTEQVFSNRCYDTTLSAISKIGSHADDAAVLFSNLRRGLQSNPVDLPAVVIYQIESQMANLVMTAGKADGTGQFVEKHKINSPSELAICKLIDEVHQKRQSIKTSDTTLLSILGQSDGSLIQGVIYPVLSELTGDLLAVVFIALNAHRRFEGSYSSFLEVLVAHIGSMMRNLKHAAVLLKHHEDIAAINATRSAELQTALEQRTKEVTDIEIRYRDMMEHSPAGIFLVDPKGAAIYANPACWHLAGAQTPEFERIDSLLQDVSTWVHPDYFALYLEKYSTMLQTCMPTEITYRAANDWPDGRWRWVSLSLRPETGEDGKVRLFHGFCVDMSYIKQVEELTDKRISDALESKRQQEAFIDITSHEMRNPLSAIAQTAELVTTGLANALHTNDHETLRRAITDAYDMVINIDLLSRHMRCIADDLIAISKINSEILVVRPMVVVVADFVKQVLGMFSAPATAQGVEVKLAFDRSSVTAEETRCQIDPARVSQILINLVSNAIKHLTRKSTLERKKVVEVNVSLTDKPPFPRDIYGPLKIPSSDAKTATPAESPKAVNTATEQHLVFSVQDNGSGLSQKDADRIFGSPTEGGPRTYSKYGGSGISLFICRRLAELQGGQICYQPVTEGSTGSRFIFYVQAPPSESGAPTANTPLEDLHNDYFEHFKKPTALGQSPVALHFPPEEVARPAQVHDMKSIPRSAPLEQSVPSIDMREQPIRALIVEDNFLNQRLLQKQLQKAGYDVEVANNGLECLNKVRDEPNFDIILLDREMPVCDGLACLLKLREMEKQGQLTTKEQRWLSVSSASSPDDLQSSRSNTPIEMVDHDGSRPLLQQRQSDPRTDIAPESASLQTAESANSSYKRRRSDHRDAMSQKKVHLIEEAQERGSRSNKLAIITISANARAEQIEEMMNAGSDDYVTKPFRFPDLDARIKKLVATLAAC